MEEQKSWPDMMAEIREELMAIKEVKIEYTTVGEFTDQEIVYALNQTPIIEEEST